MALLPVQLETEKEESCVHHSQFGSVVSESNETTPHDRSIEVTASEIFFFQLELLFSFLIV